MTSRQILTVAAVCLVTPTTASAQAEVSQPTVVLEFWKCDWADLDKIQQVADSLYVPAAQELVNEGELLFFQLLVHDWSDEWNIVFYYLASDKETFFRAHDELYARVDEQHPDSANWFLARCYEHKDGIYVRGANTDLPDPDTSP